MSCANYFLLSKGNVWLDVALVRSKAKPPVWTTCKKLRDPKLLRIQELVEGKFVLSPEHFPRQESGIQSTGTGEVYEAREQRKIPSNVHTIDLHCSWIYECVIRRTSFRDSVLISAISFYSLHVYYLPLSFFPPSLSLSVVFYFAFTRKKNSSDKSVVGIRYGLFLLHLLFLFLLVSSYSFSSIALRYLLSFVFLSC